MPHRRGLFFAPNGEATAGAVLKTAITMPPEIILPSPRLFARTPARTRPPEIGVLPFLDERATTAMHDMLVLLPRPEFAGELPAPAREERSSSLTFFNIDFP